MCYLIESESEGSETVLFNVLQSFGVMCPQGMWPGFRIYIPVANPPDTKNNLITQKTTCWHLGDKFYTKESILCAVFSNDLEGE